MLDTPRNVSNGETLEFDHCIVGAGAAGITLALEMEGSGQRICLLEGGGLEPPEMGDDHPFHGESVGREYSLISTRLRYLGGTTNHWGGWCRPLDPIDFQPRSWIPLSGWPIRRDELDPYYRKADHWCEIEPQGYGLEELPPPAPRPQTEFFEHYDSDFVTKNFRFSPPTRFGSKYRADLKRSSEISSLIDATAVEIETEGGRVSRLRVRSENKEFFVRAGSYVLAMGGIENARLMLHSDRQDQKGVGNASDYVGRCFSDHLGRTVGYILASLDAPYVLQRWNGIRILPHLSLRDEVMRKLQLVNFGVAFLNSRSRPLLDIDYLADDRLFAGWDGRQDRAFYAMVARFEPTPNRDSRVSLTDERDKYGVRRVKLDWRINGVEFESLDKVSDLLARKAGLANLGRIQRTFIDSPQTRSETITYQAHQNGTTRMSNDPSQGVVDSDCKVHGVENLYVAGSSVFPTFGFANPTLTIVALACRLADHLKSRKQRGE